MYEKFMAKKSLGQNFLKSKTALFKMIEAGEIKKTDTILEIGPGKGVLTEKLLEVANKVIAIEKDHRLIEVLQEKFAQDIKTGKLFLVNEDILEFDLQNHNLKDGPYKIIANIPYYITGQFLRKFLESNNQPERIVVMVQKEIADRIVAHNKKESLLSISVKAYGRVKKVMRVDKENFSPQPKVDSAILAITSISKDFFVDNNITEESFFKIVKAGFAHKRKMILGNLSTIQNRKNLEKIFAVCNLDFKIRAEDLTLEQWVKFIY